MAAGYATQRAGVKIAVQCAHCGCTFTVFPSRHNANKKFYCGVKCRAEHITGRNNPAYRSGGGRKVKYGDNWRRQRRAALLRDQRTCQHCCQRPTGRHRLHVHHIQPAHVFGGDWRRANALTNLITLCHLCHELAEAGRIPLVPRLL